MDTPLLTFAVITDSHLKDQGDQSSPYQANQLANSRNQYLVKQLNVLKPDFVIHLGDFVQPVPSLPTYDSAMHLSKEIFGALNPVLYSIPGNHDIGDKPLAWMPGPKVDEKGIQAYEKYWGSSYSSFDVQDIHFVLINSPVLNSQTEYEQQQKEWLEQDLEQNGHKRIFLFTHYPLYLYEPNEPEHYDNIGEPARSWLLSLIDKYEIEAVYAGHVHHFFYNRHKNTDQYVQSSLTFVRHDYSEFFQIAPEENTEGGRNDIDKMGFFMVNVYPDQHVNHYIRTYGRTLEQFNDHTSAENILSTKHMKEMPNSPFGVYLRHAWAERNVMPYANLDEFDRKVTRNDYPLLALWDMGASQLRVPFFDVLDEHTRMRMETLYTLGHQFTVFTSGIPADGVIQSIKKYQHMLKAWEIILSSDEIEEIDSRLKNDKHDIRIQILVSQIETSAGSYSKGEQKSSKYHHFIRHGFRIHDRDHIKQLMQKGNEHGSVDGLVFRVNIKENVIEQIVQIQSQTKALNIETAIHIQMQGSDNPAEPYTNDREIANQIIRITAAAIMGRNTSLFFDTFMDHDRGYYRRNGLLDRRSNPRLAYYAFKHLNSLLSEESWLDIIEGGSQYADWILLDSGKKQAVIVIPQSDRQIEIKDLNLPINLSDAADALLSVNLFNGWVMKDAVPDSIKDPTLMLFLKKDDRGVNNGL
jgi:predicted phosphodiesterase